MADDANDIEAGIIARMAAFAGLVALVPSASVYANTPIDEQPAAPYIIFNRVGGAGEEQLSGSDISRRVHYQFDIFASTRTSRKNVEVQLRACFNGYSGTSASVVIQRAALVGDFNDYDSEVSLYRATLEFEFDFLET